jgi:hypothetical protein
VQVLDREVGVAEIRDIARQQHAQHGLVVGLPRGTEGVIAGERRTTG